jgi:hypothetical protein
MSDSAITAAAATALLFLNENAEHTDRVKIVDEARAARRRALTAAEITFRRDLADAQTTAAADDALALWTSSADEAQAQFYRALRF